MADLQTITHFSSVFKGTEPFILDELMQEKGSVLYIAENEAEISFVKQVFSVLNPKREILSFLPWDTVPYDRVAPLLDITADRLNTLYQLKEFPQKRRLILTTPAAFMQKTAPLSFWENASLLLKQGQEISFEKTVQFLSEKGYMHTDKVMNKGEYAVRGGLIDVFPAGQEMPVRLDFFGDELEAIKSFDPLTQRTVGKVNSLLLLPVREFLLTPESIRLFRLQYRELFGVSDGILEAVSEGRYINGVEHFLPLFYQEMALFFDFLPASVRWVAKPSLFDRIKEHSCQIEEYYQARQQALSNQIQTDHLYYPVPKEKFFLSDEKMKEKLNQYAGVLLHEFSVPLAKEMPFKAGFSFYFSLNKGQDVFDQVADYICHADRPIVFSVSSKGALIRLKELLAKRLLSPQEISSFKSPLPQLSVLIAPFEKGFQTLDFNLITETDIFGERLIKPSAKRKNRQFIEDLSVLSEGDYVVHQTPGIGQFLGLQTIRAAGVLHDCLALEYEGGDKLFVPVENADVLSRYGNETTLLDRLGSPLFQTRKEKVRKDLFALAQRLLKTASARVLGSVQPIAPDHNLYQEFCGRFPFIETEDQLRTMSEIEADLQEGKLMDRLVCGDVGFGKTEIALRTAFLVAMSGGQVAVIVPTTLLARQHYQNFTERFMGFPLRIGMLSRLVKPAAAAAVRQELKDGTMDIVIGTHALLSKNVSFKNLSLLIIDEEQRFGVVHKEKLKELKAGIHILTLTATPIPRTLQLSLAGVKELSLIATPPIDRLSVQTYILPFDSVIIKEALLREHFRGGQSFFVCPYISDMDEIQKILSELLPDLKIAFAHGQMSPKELEALMTDFAERKYDILVATSIIESGLDMPNVNTLIVWRAEQFGLSALYQLRGRVGRGKIKAYAYLTTPENKKLTSNAEKRLSILNTLDGLGAGFALASHDLDMRGAGNLLGDDQSGHIRQIGVSLYQKMLAEAVQRLQSGQPADDSTWDLDFSPSISVGLSVLIPEDYISDLAVRMELYHRISEIKTPAEIESLRVEILDRFGPYPEVVENLFLTLQLKILARKAHIEKIEAGEKGAVISFYQNKFPNPEKLVAFIQDQLGTIKIKPDQKLLVARPWQNISVRLNGLKKLLEQFIALI